MLFFFFVRMNRMILDLIQQHVVEHFGYSHVNALRTVVARFPDDPVIKEAFYSMSISNKPIGNQRFVI